MLALFPDLLSFSFLAIAVLRITAALAFLYDAYILFMERTEISRTKVWLFNYIPEWLVSLAALVAFVIAIMLGVGMYTQAAAIVGMLITLKYAIFSKRYGSLIPFSLGTSLLLFVICFTLLVSGAGPFAIDLPL
ncbi:MAG TPA: hypothetical protein VMU25_02475 [Candidatus Paceibacterota bacterium]|nr:hypothetical protein [Candidatus Paceibacterota bacterium]